MTFPIDTTDDGTPAAALRIAAAAVRAFNHRSGQRFDPKIEGWNYTPDVYSCLGSLGALTDMLPQSMQHMGQAIRADLDAGNCGVDPTADDPSPDPWLPVNNAAAGLTAASADLGKVARNIHYSQNAIARVHYTGPNLDEADTHG